MVDRSIRCPVVLIAASGDPLFPTPDARRLFERIAAPATRFVELDLDRHLIFNECLPQVSPSLFATIAALAAPAAEGGD
jgi:alpha-beta hydrolase superfamily lysophospholipase